MTQNKVSFWAGVRAELPLLIGVFPFGMIYGALALNAGLSTAAAQLMSSIVFAGSSQFVAAQLFHEAAPALVIVGERDEAFQASSEYLATRIGGARRVVVEGAGHAANIHQPQAFNAAVLRFLDSLGLPNA